jgi:anti-sigma factor RsiW
MNCAQCEEQISDLLENALNATQRSAVELHLQSCHACTELLAGMTEVLAWGKSFPVYEAPAWLPTRIIANTPRIARESWLDTLTSVGRWIIEPRTAMALFTATLVLSWLGSLAGISPGNWTTVVRDPAAIYYGAQGLVNRAYDEAVRSYYRSPLVTQIQSRIEQLREIS